MLAFSLAFPCGIPIWGSKLPQCSLTCTAEESVHKPRPEVQQSLAMPKSSNSVLKCTTRRSLDSCPLTRHEKGVLPKRRLRRLSTGKESFLFYSPEVLRSWSWLIPKTSCMGFAPEELPHQLPGQSRIFGRACGGVALGASSKEWMLRRSHSHLSMDYRDPTHPCCTGMWSDSGPWSKSGRTPFGSKADLVTYLLS